jgi:hypothetical protein
MVYKDIFIFYILIIIPKLKNSEFMYTISIDKHFV